MRVMGIDPSTAHTGWAVFEGDKLIAYGSIDPKYSESNERKYTYEYNEIRKIIKKYKPNIVACEDQFQGKNAKTFKVLSQLRGVIMLLCEQHEIPVYYYWPNTVKLRATGSGKATKVQMVKAMKDKFNLPDISDDIADAIAVAICQLTAHGTDINL